MSEKIESLSSSDVLTTIYDVTRALFRHLPVHSVDSCSLVCQSWLHQARLTKSQRHTIHSLTYPANLLSDDKECSPVLSDFDKLMSSYINNDLWSIPQIAFVVVTNDLCSNGFYSPSSSPPPTKVLKRSCSRSRTNRTENVNISEALISHLNKSCQLLMVTSYGIIATNNKNQSNEIESDNAMGILFLPKFPPNLLGVYPFEISNNLQKSPDISRSYLHHLFGNVPDDIPIRCVILFCTRRQSHIINCIKKLREHYPSIVIIGGFVNKVHLNDRQNQAAKSPYTCGMILTGDTNHLHIRQVVLENHIHAREDIKNKLQQLKSIENNSSLSFGIQVSCIARGLDFYNNEPNVECSEFRNLFPNTPLIGIFGNGEIGHDYLPNEKQTSQQTTTTDKELLLTYSSVFSLISLHM